MHSSAVASDFQARDFTTALLPNVWHFNEQKVKIEQTAQAILNARALYPDSSLADLYDETAMPPKLRKAHQQNDRAVMQVYGFSVKDMTESKCVAELKKIRRNNHKCI